MWRKGAASSVVLPQPSLARTRRPVKDKGALMQTLHLWLQDLRAISLGQSPGRWPTPSAAIRDGTKGPPGLSNSPGPTSAVGLRPERQPQNPNRCPIVGAGLFLSLPFRRALICGATTPDLRRVCPRQTADVIHQAPALHKAGRLVDHIGKPAPQRCIAPLRWGCLFPGGPPPIRLGPEGKRQLVVAAMAPEHTVPKPSTYAQQGEVQPVRQ